MQQTLNDLFSQYSQGAVGRTDFESAVYRHLVHNQKKTCIYHWKSDEYEDFVSWFYPRLKTVIDSYQDTGSTFDAYLAKYILISSREYHIKTITNSVTEYSAWNARVPEMYTHEEPPVYLHKDTEKTIEGLIIDKKGRKNSRRILALILKCYYYVSEDFAEKIAPVIGMKSRDLLKLLKKMRKLRQDRDDKIYEMKERLYRQFYRCMIHERKLILLKENTAAYNRQVLRTKRARKLQESIKIRISKMKKEASNSQIAKVIGVSKGTVDASLSRLKAKWAVMSNKADLN